MPNWCYNSATLTSPSKDLYDKLLEAIKNDTWFQTFAPLETVDDSEDGWNYESAVAIWNTKWPPQDLEIALEDEESLTIELSFDTAWSPPTGVYSRMNKNFSIETTSYYYELGCEFFGRCMYAAEGEMDEIFDMPSNKEELLELQKQIGSELNDFMSSTWECLEEQWEQEDVDEDTDEDANRDTE
jgi:hypothetical protein